MKDDHPLDPREISDLDRVVHSPTRLKVMLVLVGGAMVIQSELQKSSISVQGRPILRLA